MAQYDHEHDDVLNAALQGLAQTTVVPPADPAREAALLDAFDAARDQRSGRTRRSDWWVVTMAAAASVLMATAFIASRQGHLRQATVAAQAHIPSRDMSQAASEFVLLPGAVTMPSLESATLVRMDISVAMLPSLGVRPPSGNSSAVKVDFIIGQDGLARAVRLVSD